MSADTDKILGDLRERTARLEVQTSNCAEKVDDVAEKVDGLASDVKVLSEAIAKLPTKDELKAAEADDKPALFGMVSVKTAKTIGVILATAVSTLGVGGGVASAVVDAAVKEIVAEALDQVEDDHHEPAAPAEGADEGDASKE